MGSRHYQKSDKERIRKRRLQVAETDDLLEGTEANALLSPNTVMQMQRTIGNQAVQRLIDGDVQHDFGNGVLPTTAIQRQHTPSISRDTSPQGADSTEKEASLPAYLAIITGERQGKFKGGSQIPGHEGEIEVQSFNIEQQNPPGGRGRPSQGNDDTRMSITFTKYADDSSTQFFRASHDGEHLKTVHFQLIRSDPRGGIKVMHNMEFSDGLITSYQVSGSSSDGRPMEVISIEFPKGPS